MKTYLLAFALLAGCGTSERTADNRNEAGPPVVETSAGTGLTGLYEGGRGAQPDQLCIVEKGATAQFGMVVWGGNMHSCSGSGQAVREGGRVTLKMAGDSSCEIAATMRGGAISLPAATPAGCDYYCAPGARGQLAGAAFTRKGATAADAMKAKDLVGEPLCSR